MDWTEGVNGYSSAAGFNTCILWIQMLILYGRVVSDLVAALSNAFLVAGEISF
jgi:hypothetical protein